MPVRVAWNGIDPAAFASTPARRAAGREFRRRLGLGPHDFVLLVLANPRPQKRLDRLPDVLAATRAELARAGSRREARLVIAGEASRSSPAAIGSVEAVRARGRPTRARRACPLGGPGHGRRGGPGRGGCA